MRRLVVKAVPIMTWLSCQWQWHVACEGGGCVGGVVHGWMGGSVGWGGKEGRGKYLHRSGS